MSKNMLEHKNFCGIVGYSVADKCFFGRLLGTNELITFKGKSMAKLRTAFTDAVDDYLFLQNGPHYLNEP